MKPTKGQRFQDLPDVLSVADASSLLRINRGSVYEMVHRREIPAVRIGRRVLIPKSGLAKMLGLPVTPAARVSREGAREPTPQSDLTLRGSFVITVRLQREDGPPS